MSISNALTAPIRTTILILITIGVVLMVTNCSANDSGDAHQPANPPSLPTCAQIAEVLGDMVADLESVDLVLTDEDLENKAWCSWRDIPSGKSVFIGASFGDYAIQKIRDRQKEQTHMEPDSFLAEPDEPQAQDSIFAIREGSAAVYEQGCEVNLTYFTPTFSVRFIGEEYVIDQAKEATLRVAKLIRN
ncbi:hypothetical protein [Mycolicibacterium fortuitum]|uniref:hypothetical protein n=1 Tax=Mycolicibacterium fortuitum TaxID=1766 RepID=UPI00262C8FED|nr:hypothetical protein [Mycolicibacterium fortuitum]